MLTVRPRETVEQGSQITIAGSKLACRPLLREELSQAIQMTIDEGWATTLEDMQLAYDAYPGSFDGLFSVSGQLVGFCTTAALDEHTGILAFLVVDKLHRGSTLGTYLFELGVRKMGDRNVILDSVQGAEGYYAERGFKETGMAMEYYEWTVKDFLSDPQPGGLQVTPLQELAGDKLVALLKYDRDLQPIERNLLMEIRLSPEQTDQAESFCAFSAAGDVVGFVLVKMTDKGHRVGPLYADDTPTAKVLLDRVHRSLGVGTKLFCYSPSVNANWPRLLEELEIYSKPMSSERRMQTKTGPSVDWCKVYAAIIPTPSLCFETL